MFNKGFSMGNAVQAAPVAEPPKPSRVAESIPIATGVEARDSLLAEFTPGQRDYIIHKIYPVIKKSLTHFIAEATLHDQIQERVEQSIPANELIVEDDLTNVQIASQRTDSIVSPGREKK